MFGIYTQNAGDVFYLFVLQVFGKALFPLRRGKCAVVIAFVACVQQVVEPFQWTQVLRDFGGFDHYIFSEGDKANRAIPKTFGVGPVMATRLLQCILLCEFFFVFGGFGFLFRNYRVQHGFDIGAGLFEFVLQIV